MDQTRRAFLAVATTTGVVTRLFAPGSGEALAAETPAGATRLLTFVPKAGGEPRIGIALDEIGRAHV